MQIANTAANPGASPAAVPSAAGAVVFAAAGFTFVAAGVTRSPGGASVAVAAVVAAGDFVAATVGVGVPNHPGGYVPAAPRPPDGVGVAAGLPASRNMLHSVTLTQI